MKTFTVSWRNESIGSIRLADIQCETESDIPRILALHNGITASQVNIIRLYTFD